MRPFGNDITNRTNNRGNGNDEDNSPRLPPEHIERMGGVMAFSPIAGRGVIRVVERCEDAKENNMLDLSQCQLIHVPDAVYHLMRHTELKTCDLSENVIKKIPPKLAIKFSLLTDLNLSHNQLAKLPDELADLSALAQLNISNNSFIVLPQVVFKMPKLRKLDASHNHIIEIDTDEMISSDSLELVDLRHNPFTRASHRKLKNAVTGFRIEISEYDENADEDW